MGLSSMSAARHVVGLLNLTPKTLSTRSFSTNNINMGKAYVVGVGMTKFEKPGRRENFDYPDMAKEAVENALTDAGLKYSDVEQACVGYVYGDSTCGQRALYPLGMTGIPVYNVNNNCATGSSALFLANQLVRGGLSDCVLALGFEKMQKGSLSATFSDRENPVQRHVEAMMQVRDLEAAPIAPQMFGNAGREHMEKYGTKPEHFAKIAWKNHKHSVNNPYSQFQDEYSMEQISGAPMVHQPLTKLQCCPTSDGGAAAVVVSEEFVKQRGLESRAAEKLYKKAGVSAKDVQVVELHDCFSANELVTYEALGLCEVGKAGEFIDAGDNTYGGKYVVNPSGGLISKGHPLGATGLAQCYELSSQVRGEAANRQVAGAKMALQHNLGLGGAVVVALYKMGFPEQQQHKAKL